MFLWSGIYFWLQMREIYHDIDEGLINLKQEFVLKANKTQGFVENMEHHQPLNLRVNEISFEQAEQMVENFQTTGVYFSTELEYEEVRMLTSAFYCEQNGKYYQIQFFTSTVETNDIVKNILYLTFALWIAVVLTLILVSKIVILRANKPFYKLLDELKRFRLDNRKNITFPKTKVTEYIQLNDTVNELIAKNINIFTEQKEFIENCSHELQTPLAVAITKLELLIEKYQNNEIYIQELTELVGVLNRMKRLNSSLLLLSKIKNNQFSDLQYVNLNEVLQKSLNELSDFIQYKEIVVCFENKKTIEREINVDLAHILFTNLLKNAITHNEQGGRIEISCMSNSITIANTGGIQPLDNIFSRYRQIKTDVKHSGIGLSIVKSIADLYKIKIEYRFTEKKHIFKLNFV
jgi:signal transduction histidine kinase